MVGETNTAPVETAKPAATQPATAKPAPETPATATGEMPKSIWKQWWMWTIIAVVVIGLGAGAYFLLM